MFKPAAVFIGLRYMRAKRRNQFISLISLISMLGIALGVIVLITVLSVLNGFDREIKSQIFGMISPITITSYVGQIEDWQELEKVILASPDITAAAPFANGQAILTNSNITQPTLLIGVLPAQEKGVSVLSKKMLEGKLADLTPGQFGIVLGNELANQLDVKMGDPITVATIKGSFSTNNVIPRFSKFKVVGIFRAGGGGMGFDSKMAFINLYDAQKFLQLNSSISGFQVNVKNIYSAPKIALALQDRLPQSRVWNWTEQLGDFFENIRLTKTMMFFIFVLIIAVAVFNLICTMVMVVRNKQTDIAILRTMGATPVMILAIFIVQGLAIGIGGTLLGVAGGILLSQNITVISTWLQQVLHVQLISSKVYFVNYLPAELQWQDVLIISLIALILSLLATLYPAWNASRVEPAEALRDN